MSLLDLSDELLIQILTDDHSYSSQFTVRAALRTCRRLNAIATTVLYSRVICYHDMPNWKSHLCHVFLDYDQRLAKYPERAKEAKVSIIACPWACTNPEIWDTVQRILQRVSSLRQLQMRIGRRWSQPCARSYQDGDRGSVFMNLERNFMSLVETSSFDNLEEAHLDDEVIVTEEIVAFLRLPKIKKLQITGFKGACIHEKTLVDFSSTLEILTVYCDVLPAGNSVQQILAPCTSLKKLRWIAEADPFRCIHESRDERSYDIASTLKPLQSSLQEAHIIATLQHSLLPETSLNLAAFSVLINLKISYSVLFGTNTNKCHNLDLMGRLPLSLRILQVVFSTEDITGQPQYEPPLDGSWLLELACAKEIESCHIQSLKLWYSPSQEDFVKQLITCSIQEALEAAGISFTVQPVEEPPSKGLFNGLS